MSSKTRVVIADDDRPIRGLVARLLENTEFEVVGMASTGAEAVEITKALIPDIVLLDRGLPDDCGYGTLRSLIQQCPNTRVVVFSGDGSPVHVRQAMELGASGYVVKGDSAVNLMRALRLAAGGAPAESHGIHTRES